MAKISVSFDGLMVHHVAEPLTVYVKDKDDNEILFTFWKNKLNIEKVEQDEAGTFTLHGAFNYSNCGLEDEE